MFKGWLVMFKACSLVLRRDLMDYKLVVIGSGPADWKASTTAASLGGSVDVVDRQSMFGGVCLRTGGVPSKTLRETVPIFVLMASRRLKSDRFFTSDFRPEIYTQEGLDWIEHSDMRDVILRHMPELEPYVHPQNAFAPWKPAHS